MFVQAALPVNTVLYSCSPPPYHMLWHSMVLSIHYAVRHASDFSVVSHLLPAIPLCSAGAEGGDLTMCSCFDPSSIHIFNTLCFCWLEIFSILIRCNVARWSRLRSYSLVFKTLDTRLHTSLFVPLKLSKGDQLNLMPSASNCLHLLVVSWYQHLHP